MKVKVGIIGYGKIGKLRHKILNNINCVDVVSIYDPLKKKSNKNIYSNSAQDILKNSSIDTVFIATPNYLNHKYTLQALINNKNVFCEKPPATSENQLKEIIKIEKKTKKKLMYGFNHRHHNSIKKMRNIIQSNKLGNILWMRGRYGKSVDNNFLNNWRSKKKYSGGGILMDQGIHMLDLLNYFSGGFDIIKSIVSKSYWNLSIEDNVFAIFKNKKNNISASLHSTITQWRHLFSLEIFLENGYLVLNGLKTSSNSYGTEELSVAINRTPLPRAISLKEKKYIYKTDNSFFIETKIFIKSIINNHKIQTCNSNEALQIMKILSKIYKDG